MTSPPLPASHGRHLASAHSADGMTAETQDIERRARASAGRMLRTRRRKRGSVDVRKGTGAAARFGRTSGRLLDSNAKNAIDRLNHLDRFIPTEQYPASEGLRTGKRMTVEADPRESDCDVESCYAVPERVSRRQRRQPGAVRAAMRHSLLPTRPASARIGPFARLNHAT